MLPATQVFYSDRNIYRILKLKKNTRFVIIRFVSWRATHDYGHSGISKDNKLRAVEEFSKYARVFISSEENLPQELKKYELNIPPEKYMTLLPLLL